MNFIRIFNALSDALDGRLPFNGDAIAMLAFNGNLRFEKDLTIQQSLYLSDLLGAGEIGRSTLPTGDVFYYDRLAAQTYQLSTPHRAPDSFLEKLVTPRRTLANILHDFSEEQKMVPAQTLNGSERFKPYVITS